MQLKSKNIVSAKKNAACEEKLPNAAKDPIAEIAPPESDGICAQRLAGQLANADIAAFVRAAVTLGRLGEQSVVPQLISLLQTQSDTVKRLCLLDVLHSLRPPNLAVLLAPFVQDEDLLFVRGVVWLSGAAGGEDALPALCAFLQSAKQQCIKDELLAESFWLAADGDEQRLLRLAEENDAFARFAAHRRWPKRSLNYSYFGVYPYPDYLWQKAKKAGLSQKEFRALWHRPRSKSPHPRPAELNKTESGKNN